MKHFSIIVTYEPKISLLESACTSLILQSSVVVIVDNSERVLLKDISTSKCIIIRNGKNIGIAAAQNIGIKYALSKGAEVISFFDQDSEIENNLLTKLLLPFKDYIYCVTAPVSINKQNGKEYPTHILNQFGWPKKVFSIGFDRPYPVDLVISSGLTVSIEILKRIGNFDEDFFIDFVDIEWCLRCYKKKIKILVIPTAKMSHSIGDRDLNVGKIVCSIHSPERTYYKIRNSFLIMKKDVPILFFIKQCSSAVIKNLITILKANNKKKYIWYYYFGILDGINDQRGKMRKKYEN